MASAMTKTDDSAVTSNKYWQKMKIIKEQRNRKKLELKIAEKAKENFGARAGVRTTEIDAFKVGR